MRFRSLRAGRSFLAANPQVAAGLWTESVSGISVFLKTVGRGSLPFSLGPLELLVEASVPVRLVGASASALTLHGSMPTELDLTALASVEIPEAASGEIETVETVEWLHWFASVAPELDAAGCRFGPHSHALAAPPYR